MRLTPMKLRTLLALSAGALTAGVLTPPTAGAAEAVPGMMRAVENHLRINTAGLPGTVSFTVGKLDPRVQLPACAALEVFTPPGARLWGNTNVGVRCASPVPWTVYIAVAVQVTGTYVATARALAGGQALSDGDMAVVTGDLTQLPAGVLTETRHALGKTLAAPLAAGQPLRGDQLRAPRAIQQGQSVRLLSGGPGFQVSTEGRALGHAAAGEVVQVRSPSGATISGIAQPGGIVEVNY